MRSQRRFAVPVLEELGWDADWASSFEQLEGNYVRKPVHAQLDRNGRPPAHRERDALPPSIRGRRPMLVSLPDGGGLSSA